MLMPKVLVQQLLEEDLMLKVFIVYPLEKVLMQKVLRQKQRIIVNMQKVNLIYLTKRLPLMAML
jgi:hypothetical protein